MTHFDNIKTSQFKMKSGKGETIWQNFLFFFEFYKNYLCVLLVNTLELLDMGI